MSSETQESASPEKFVLFVGTNLSHAVSNITHDEVAKSIGLNWRLLRVDNPSLDEFVRRKDEATFGGAVITIPHKISVMAHLDRIEPIGLALGACNNVYKAEDGQLVGTNTDWIGVRDSLLSTSQLSSTSLNAVAKHDLPGWKMPGFVVGAGGAARAAVFALCRELRASVIYVINRDDTEVEQLRANVKDGYQTASLDYPEIIHLKSPTEALKVDVPYYGVGTVPDFEPQSQAEIAARDTLEAILGKGRGVFLDMCYKPRRTRSLKLAESKGWTTVEGSQVAAWQLRAQWKLWAGEEWSNKISVPTMVERNESLLPSSVPLTPLPDGPGARISSTFDFPIGWFTRPFGGVYIESAYRSTESVLHNKIPCMPRHTWMVVRGKGLLVEQALAQIELWTGMPAPRDLMRQSIL